MKYIRKNSSPIAPSLFFKKIIIIKITFLYLRNLHLILILQKLYIVSPPLNLNPRVPLFNNWR